MVLYITTFNSDIHFIAVKKLLKMSTIEAIEICNGDSSKQMKTDDSSWKRIGIKLKQMITLL